MIHRKDNRTIWLKKSWDIKHGLGWFCQVYVDYEIGFGFSKNKFTATRLAFKDIGKTF